jgi:hypothetical protein
MPETNGESPFTGDPSVDAALKRIRQRDEARFWEIRDSIIVLKHLEKRWGEQVKNGGLAEYVRDHESRLQALEQSLIEYEKIQQRIEANLAEIAAKANFLFDREMKREGGPEVK